MYMAMIDQWNVMMDIFSWNSKDSNLSWQRVSSLSHMGLRRCKFRIFIVVLFDYKMFLEQ